MIHPPPGLLFLLLFFTFNSVGQDLQVQSITIDDGLSQGFITSLFEDSRGYIWVGTLQGLNRYDGYQIKRYNPDLSKKWALQASFIHEIIEDSKGLLWIGTEKGVTVFDPYTERFLQLTGFVDALPDEMVTAIYEMANGDIALVYRQAPHFSLQVLRPPGKLRAQIREDRVRAEQFQVLLPRFAANVAQPLLRVCQFGKPGLLIADAKNQLCRVDPETYRVQRIAAESSGYELDGNLGLFYNPKTRSGAYFMHRNAGVNQITPAKLWPPFLQLQDGTRVLYRQADNQLYVIKDGMNNRYLPNVDNPQFYESQQHFVTLDKGCSSAALIDHAGNLWVGTSGYGVRKISLPMVKYRQILPENTIYNFVPLPDGTLWPGLYSAQTILDLNAEQLNLAPWLLAPSRLVPFGMLVARDSTIWMACRNLQSRLMLYKKVKNRELEPLPIEMTLVNDLPIQFLQDCRGKIWVAGNKGDLLRIDPQTDRVESWNIGAYFPGGWATWMRSNCLIESDSNTLWIATNQGLVQVTQADSLPVFKSFYNKRTATWFNNEYILSISPDRANPHVLWLGTRGGGLNRFDSRGGPSEFYTVEDGLPDNVVYGILHDSAGRLWLSTNRGLSVFSPATGQFVTLAEPGMALFTEFNTCAYRTLASGELAFGSTQGLFILQPESLKQLIMPGAVAISKMRINGVPIDFSAADPRLSLNAGNIFTLTLPFDQNNLSLEFSALRSSNPASVKYRYRLAGLTDQWVETGRQRNINLAAIPAGRHTLELQCTIPGAGWKAAHTTRIELQVQPPWYRSLPAYGFYLLLGLGLLRLYLFYDRRRLQARHTVTLKEKELQRLQQLDDFKKRFFSYIAHEFKTPLTIILGLADRLRRENLTAAQIEYATKIHTQGRNMLELVDQVLDIGKLDEGNIRLHWEQGLISAYLLARVEAMRPLATFKNIRLVFETATPELVMDYDPTRLKYVLNNLITNAIEHTPSGGLIRVATRQDDPEALCILVADSGPGIPTEEQPHIFDRYFQGKSSVRNAHHAGLGLAYVRDLVHLFGGIIVVDSRPDSGTTFTVTLPVRQNAQPAGIQPAPEIPTRQPEIPARKHQGPAPGNLPGLLVVEDNPFITEHLRLCLADHFQLDFATDGRAGFERALATIPDLVLTDVMMPEMDGLDLTAHLKSNALTSHIPVVVLSAKSEIADRLAGHTKGANAYLGKPFDEAELLLILQNLYALQLQWRQRYSQLSESADPIGQLTAAAPTETPEADEFMLNLYRLFEKNYANEKYDLNWLCRDFQISRSQLQRKLAALSDHSAMTLLRRFRLQKAYALLEQYPEKNIKEICFLVGFKDPAHFTRMFTKTFDRTPSSVRHSA
ncbi:MAG: ATP-binding protein [Saprospiraceae bacterium]